MTADPTTTALAAEIRAARYELEQERLWRARLQNVLRRQRWVLIAAAVVVVVSLGVVGYIALGNRKVVCSTARDNRDLIEAVTDATGIVVDLPPPPEGC
ncbi:MAG TPA: hypothetical protein VGB14_09720 [Acidimicrobiales bacterium]